MPKLVFVPNESTVKFPAWVTGPTPCKTRSFSIVLPKHKAFTPHGATKLVESFPNKPMVVLRRKGAPGYYLGWAFPIQKVKRENDDIPD